METPGLPNLCVGVIVVALFCAVPVFGQMPDPAFVAEPAIAVGTGPSFVTAGDVNGDAKLDLVVSNRNGASVSVLLGNNDGTFGAAITSDAGAGAQGIGLGHLDGDNHLDLVVANSDADSISILIGDGTGNFTETSEFPLGDFPHGLALGQVNGDLHLDVIVASAYDSTVYYLEGNGDGTFDPAVVLLNDTTNARWCQTVALGDLNGDNDLDIVTGNHQTNNISVLLGNGDGTFGAPAHYVTDDTPGNIGGRVTIADLNKDQQPDLIIGNESSADITVLLNLGGGIFHDVTPTDRYPAGTSPVEVVASDFDADGNVDVAVASYGADDDVYVYPGFGDGTFDSANVQTFDAGIDSWGMTGATLDEETLVDLAVAAHGDDQVVVLLNQTLNCIDLDGDGWGYPGSEFCPVRWYEDCNDDPSNDASCPAGTCVPDCTCETPECACCARCVHFTATDFPEDGIDTDCDPTTPTAWETATAASTLLQESALPSKAVNHFFLVLAPLAVMLLWKRRRR